MFAVVAGCGRGNGDGLGAFLIGRGEGSLASGETAFQSQCRQVVEFIDGEGADADVLGFAQSVGGSSDVDGAGGGGGAHEHTTDSAFHGQRGGSDVVVGGVLGRGSIQQGRVEVEIGVLELAVVACSDSAYPLSFAGEREVEDTVVQGAATTLLVNDFSLDEYHVCSVGLRALGVLDCRQLEVVRFTSGGELIVGGALAVDVAHGTQCSCLVVYAVEREQVVVVPSSVSEAAVVQEELNVVGIGNDINLLDRSYRVVPVAYDVGGWNLVVHPACPHHAVCEKGVLGNAHGIRHATHAEVGLTAVMSVGVRKNNLHASGADASACAGAFQPVVVPAAHHFHGKGIHVMVVLDGRLAAIERSAALAMVGIALFIPIFAESFVATIFHGPHGSALALVDVQHLASVVRFLDVQHLAAADGSASVGVVLVAQGLHLDHVFAADALVSAFIEDDAGVVAIVDDGIAHQLHALLPSRAFHIFLGVAGRHRLHQSHAVA